MFFLFHHRFIRSLTLILFISGTFLLSGCSLSYPAQSFSEASGFYFDTVISVRIYEKEAQAAADQCIELAAHYEQLLSPYIEGSDIWKLNHSNGTPTSVAEDTLEILTAALSYARSSEGAVDPTIGALSFLWNFGSASPEKIPDEGDITQALSHVDYSCVEINQNRVTLTDPEAQIDLGFIAKGFIGDKIKEYLLSQEISSALIYLGGNVVTVGNRPDSSPFRIGIQDPSAGQGNPLLTLDISDKSVVSSGDYERFFEQNGKKYHHILSTATGYPVRSGLSQVTIVSPASLDGDALSTLCFILGYEKAASLLKEHPDIQAVFVTEGGDIFYVNF